MANEENKTSAFLSEEASKILADTEFINEPVDNTLPSYTGGWSTRKIKSPTKEERNEMFYYSVADDAKGIMAASALAALTVGVKAKKPGTIAALTTGGLIGYKYLASQIRDGEGFWDDYYESKYGAEDKPFNRGAAETLTFGTMPKEMMTGEGLEQIGEMTTMLYRDIAMGTAAVESGVGSNLGLPLISGINQAITDYNQRTKYGMPNNKAVKYALARGIATAGGGWASMKIMPALVNWSAKYAFGAEKFVDTGVGTITEASLDASMWGMMEMAGENIILEDVMGEKPIHEYDWKTALMLGGIGAAFGTGIAGLKKILPYSLGLLTRDKKNAIIDDIADGEADVMMDNMRKSFENPLEDL